MKLTKNQLYTIVKSICNNEQQKIRDRIEKRKSSKEVMALVEKAEEEFKKISDPSWRISYGDSCPKNAGRVDRDTLIKWAMRELGYNESTYLPSGFQEQIELKVQMCFIDAKDLTDLEKRVGYKFVIV